MRIALLGFGLIGGSIARALRSAPARSGAGWEIAAWSPSGRGPAAAVAEGVLDRAATSAGDALDGAELVVLAAPPIACLSMLDELGGELAPSLAGNAVVTDVASTKQAVVRRAARLGIRFVGGHPMAGRESTGFASATADLFVGRPWVVVPGTDAAAEALLLELVEGCRAVPIRLSAEEHDAAVAAISHLPLVLSAALVEAVAGRDGSVEPPGWDDARRLAATGWHGMVRLARGDPEMGAGILATNADAVARRLRDVRDVLDGWLAELERDGGPDAVRLAERFRAAQARAGDGA